MNKTAIPRQHIRTLQQFYDLMNQTAALRRVIVAAVLAGGPDFGVGQDTVAALRNGLESLQDIPKSPSNPGRFMLAVNEETGMELELDYEISELGKDILYLEAGEAALLEKLEAMHEGFGAHVEAVRECINAAPVNSLVSDRDGTVNNYCGRYRSSIQSVYNAVYLTRFAQKKAKAAVMLTSAPLQAPGVLDVTVSPAGAMYLAASKGRECLDLEGKRRSYPIAPEQQAVLNALNQRLREITDQAGYRQFTLIGSGLQFKFGQTTVARQDIAGSIPPSQSEAFLRTIQEIVADMDPTGDQLRIEDTGLDVEIILTLPGAGKDFDKGDGVRFLDQELSLDMASGGCVVCGDTNSDVPMLQTALELNPDARAIFVTRKQELADKVRGLCPNAVIVPEPDALVVGLGKA